VILLKLLKADLNVYNDNIFRNKLLLNCCLQFRKIRTAIVFYPQNLVNFLERPSDGKSKAVSLAREEDSRQLFGKADPSVRVVIIDQPERDVNDGNLYPQLDTHT